MLQYGICRAISKIDYKVNGKDHLKPIVFSFSPWIKINTKYMVVYPKDSQPYIFVNDSLINSLFSVINQDKLTRSVPESQLGEDREGQICGKRSRGEIFVLNIGGKEVSIPILLQESDKPARNILSIHIFCSSFAIDGSRI